MWESGYLLQTLKFGKVILQIVDTQQAYVALYLNLLRICQLYSSDFFHAQVEIFEQLYQIRFKFSCRLEKWTKKTKIQNLKKE